MNKTVVIILLVSSVPLLVALRNTDPSAVRLARWAQGMNIGDGIGNTGRGSGNDNGNIIASPYIGAPNFPEGGEHVFGRFRGAFVIFPNAKAEANAEAKSTESNAHATATATANAYGRK